MLIQPQHQKIQPKLAEANHRATIAAVQSVQTLVFPLASTSTKASTKAVKTGRASGHGMVGVEPQYLLRS